jgi:hypothetical protein
MNVSQLKRDAARVHSALDEVGGRLVAKQALSIHIPRTYASGQLGSIETAVRCVGFFAVVVDGYYAVSNVCAIVTLVPSEINVVKIEEEDYLILKFNVGDTIMPSLDLVRTAPLVFNIYDEIVAKGKTPWYLDYVDLGSLFDTAQHHANMNLNADRAILEMIAAARARNPDDRTKYYRNIIQKDSDLGTYKPDMIPLRSVAFGATSTTSKLLGSYLNEGLTSALVNPTERLEKVEELLLS